MGLQVEKGKPGRGRREGGKGASQTSPDTLGSLPLWGCAGLGLEIHPHQDGESPVSPAQRFGGEITDRASGDPLTFVCAKPASPFPSLLRLPSQETDFPLSIPVR